MKLLILSDLHLEFSNFIPPAEADIADVVVLAGDIWLNDHGIHWARATWPNQEIVYVAGNHEFYKREHGAVLESLHAAAAETGVHFLDDEAVIIQGVRFLGATMWTDFELYGKERREDCLRAARQMNDFKIIKKEGRTFTPLDSFELFKKSIAFLQQKLQKEEFPGKTIVVTHHLPSIRSVVDEYLGDLLSASFASNVDFLLKHAHLWIHGHTHDSLDYIADGCRVICNPRGYSTYSMPVENFDFKPAMIVEI